jgi:hypothetical protein
MLPEHKAPGGNTTNYLSLLCDERQKSASDRATYGWLAGCMVQDARDDAVLSAPPVGVGQGTNQLIGLIQRGEVTGAVHPTSGAAAVTWTVPPNHRFQSPALSVLSSFAVATCPEPATS